MREQDLGKILIYKNEKGDTKIDVYFEVIRFGYHRKALLNCIRFASLPLMNILRIYFQRVNLMNQLLGNS